MNLDKFMGCSMGIAVGDALGVPFETMTADEIENLEILGYLLNDYFCPSINPHPFPDVVGKPKGSWSDDTQLTLVTMESLIEGNGNFDMDILARRHGEAYQNREQRGWGKSTKRACKRLSEGIHWTQSGEPDGRGNGVMMKIAPLALLQSMQNEKNYIFLKNCVDYGRMTHRCPPAVVAGFVHAHALTILLTKNDHALPEDFLDNIINPSVFVEDYFPEHQRISEQLFVLKELRRTGALASMEHKEIGTLFGGGTKEAFAAHNSIATAYAAFLRNPHDFNCMFDCIRMGGDTDSNAAVTGSLLGALHGASIIPQKFIENLEQREYIKNRVKEFFRVCVS